MPHVNLRKSKSYSFVSLKKNARVKQVLRDNHKKYFSDHNPPHFHAEYESYKAEYDIETLDRLAGILPNRAHALVLEWASLHKDELIANWEKAQVPAKLDKIEPLK